MNERELLEMAAKAAGVEGVWREVHGSEAGQNACGIGNATRWGDGLWNPLLSNADAFGLAVVLEMDVCFGANYVIVDGHVQNPTIRNDGDKAAAVREAVVRAAVGRQLSAELSER